MSHIFAAFSKDGSEICCNPVRLSSVLSFPSTEPRWKLYYSGALLTGIRTLQSGGWMERGANKGEGQVYSRF